MATKRGINRGAWIGSAVLLSAGALVACGDDDDMEPDPGPPGAETELDGGEADPGGDGSTTLMETTGGGGSGGGTEGNQMAPGETTPLTSPEDG